jgi:allantoinase
MCERGFALSDVAHFMASEPAELAQIGGRKGKIAPGYDADLAIFDPDILSDIDANSLHTRHLISPYIGTRLRGKVVATFVRGQAAFEHSAFATTPFGQEV